ncbi:MAG TPA: hypothetical protein PLV62_04620, partial [Spirochaetota bacterium]|nr:hypothetical protein [Spirochaetota bacterium]
VAMKVYKSKLGIIIENKPAMQRYFIIDLNVDIFDGERNIATYSNSVIGIINNLIKAGAIKYTKKKNNVYAIVHGMFHQK